MNYKQKKSTYGTIKWKGPKDGQKIVLRKTKNIKTK